MARMTDLQSHLAAYDAAAWQRAVDTLSAEIHPIDREATIIWFAFYPLELHVTLAEAADPQATARRLGLMGTWRLADQIDSSHRFFYAHRYWPQVKLAVQNAEAPFPSDLAELASAVAICRGAPGSRRSRVPARHRRGRTDDLPAGWRGGLRRGAGPHPSPGQGARDVPAPGDEETRARRLAGPARIRARPAQAMDGDVRRKRSGGGVHGHQRPGDRVGGADGQARLQSRDPRCTPGEGPIPVECRAASCGTCWVGVLGGAEKLSPVVDRDERRRMEVFGYTDSSEERPLIRLACQARAFGAVSIVIPPWNGLIGPCRASRR